MTTLELVAEIASFSNPAKSYQIQRDGPDGRLTCTCPDYLQRRRFRGEDCKHIKAVKQAMAEAGQQ